MRAMTTIGATRMTGSAARAAGSRWWLALWSLLIGLLLASGSAYAQVEGDTLIGDDGSMYNEKGEYIGDQSGEGADDWKDAKDFESPKDSTAKKVKEKTDFLDPVALMNGRSARSEATYRPEEMLYPDMMERLSGFSMSLGQWGMPYLRYKYGTESSNLEQGHYINPITGAENAYFLDPAYGMRYYDTRTPYLNAYYGQGKADAAQMRVDVSQNVHPLINVAALYYRRQCKGVYTNMVTDHNTVGVSSNFHTLDERYQVFAHWLFQQHDDQVHGGVVIIRPDSILFDQGSQPVSLLGANLRRLSRAASVRQFYRITQDTIQPKHTLLVYNGVVTDYLLNQFIDRDIEPAVNANIFPVYPTLGDSTFFNEKMELGRVRIDAGLTYRLNTARWQLSQRLELAQEFLTYRKNLASMPYNRSTADWRGGLSHETEQRVLEANWQYRQTVSTIFRPESFADVEVAFRIGEKRTDYSYKVQGPPLNPKDSTTVTKTHRQLGLLLHSLSYGRNPTLQQTYGTGWWGNTFTTNPNLNNRRINHVSLGVELRGKDQWTKNGEQIGNRLRITAFSSRQSGMIYYAFGQDFVQAGRKEVIAYAGVELKLRAHWKKFFVETETVVQGFSANSPRLETQFKKSQPPFYSKTSIFYENKDLAFAKLLRFGLDYSYFSTYDAPYYEPSTQAFYAQGDLTSFFQFAYPRADVWASVQVKRAFIFVKYINLLENVPQVGYFTTMGYPMQVRQLQLGVNWTFFD